MNWLNRGLLLVPFPQEVKETGLDWTLPKRLTISLPSVTTERLHLATEWLAEDLRRLTGVEAALGQVSGLSRADIRVDLGPATGHAEGYTLDVRADGVTLIGDDEAGLAHGMQTLAQLVAFAKTKGIAPGIEIRDWPRYALRAVMLDIGRAPHPRPLIERVIRIMARLKLNLLHLHVHDDELNGVIYETLPLGRENPTALPISTYGEMMRYAEKYGVQVMPELEAWGHVASLVHHYPHLYGFSGVNSQSFAIGEPTYDLLEKMIAEWAPLLQGDPARLHVGLDEADWVLLKEVPPERQGDYSPMQHVRRLYEIVQRQGARQGKEIEMHLWADHGGRPIPEELTHKVVVQPWQYHILAAEQLKSQAVKYAGAGKAPFMMGAGASFIHEHGVFSATKLWCRAAKDAPNCRGVTICLWGTNDVGGRLISLFGGADYAWTPDTPADRENDAGDEWTRGMIARRMKHWQAHFPDGDPHMLEIERGPEVLMGRYVWPPRAGVPVGPTADWEQTGSQEAA